MNYHAIFLKVKKMFRKQKYSYLVTALLFTALSGLVVWQNERARTFLRQKEKASIVQTPLQNFRGKIYIPPIGSIYDDYFVSTEGKAYGIQGKNSALEEEIKKLRNSGKEVLIEGSLVNGVKDYGDRRIRVDKIFLGR